MCVSMEVIICLIFRINPQFIYTYQYNNHLLKIGNLFLLFLNFCLCSLSVCLFNFEVSCHLLVRCTCKDVVLYTPAAYTITLAGIREHFILSCMYMYTVISFYHACTCIQSYTSYNFNDHMRLPRNG